MSRRLMEATAGVAAAGIFVTGCQPNTTVSDPSPWLRESTPKSAFCKPIGDIHTLSLDIGVGALNLQRADEKLGVKDIETGYKVVASCSRTFTRKELASYVIAPKLFRVPPDVNRTCVAWSAAAIPGHPALNNVLLACPSKSRTHAAPKQSRSLEAPGESQLVSYEESDTSIRNATIVVGLGSLANAAAELRPADVPGFEPLPSAETGLFPAAAA